MKLIYITSKKFPSSKADPFYVKKMAEAFSDILGQDFLFFVRGVIPDEFKNINTISAKIPKRFRTVFYFFYLPIFIVLKKWNRKETIFLSYDPYLLSILIFWRKILRFKYKIVSDWHQLFDDWKDKYVSLNSDYLTCTSNRLKKLLNSVCGTDINKILTAYGGVDTSIFFEKLKIQKKELRERLKLPTDLFLIGYVGGFRSVGLEKGLDIMIKALPSLPEKIQMVFVGGSKQHINEYIKLAREKNIEQRCIFVEKQPFEKMVEYELAMDVLTIPYPNKYHFRNYGFPMKVWEYMATGNIIIYSNLEIISEVLGNRAISFQPDSVKSFEEAVLFVYKNINKAKEIAQKNIIDVQNYTWDKRAKNIINFINHKNK